MSTAAVSTSSLYQELQAYFQQRGSDLQQLGQSLQSGDLAGAQQEFTAIQTLAQGGPFANGDPFSNSQREQDFNAVGQALQSGNVASAQQAFAQLESTFQSQGAPAETAQPQPPYIINLGPSPSVPITTSPTGSTTPGGGTGIVVNLGTVTAGEQIQIDVNNTANGGEQVSVSISNPSSANPGSANPQPQQSAATQAYLQQRGSDLQQLSQALQSGNLTSAQQEYTAIQTLAQSGPFTNGAAFSRSQREQDFNAVGQALQSGDVASAQQAFSQLESTFQSQPSTSAGGTGSETEIVVNIGSAPAGEQLQIGLNNTGNGTEQVTVSASNPQNQNPEQFTFNLNQNSNQEILINLFNGNSSSQTQAQGSAVNVAA